MWQSRKMTTNRGRTDSHTRDFTCVMQDSRHVCLTNLVWVTVWGFIINHAHHATAYTRESISRRNKLFRDETCYSETRRDASDGGTFPPVREHDDGHTIRLTSMVGTTW